MLENTVREDIRAFLSEQSVYSTHEHLRYEEEALAAVSGQGESILALFTFHYTRSDFISANGSEDDISFIERSELSFRDRHRRFMILAERCRNTTQMRVLRNGLKELYGGDVFDPVEAEEMQSRRLMAHRVGIYHTILQNRARIALLCRDCGDDFKEPQYFRTAVRLENWLGVSSVNDLRALERSTGSDLSSLAKLASGVRAEAERLVRRGAIAFKNAMIYRRDPAWICHPVADVEKAFRTLNATVHAEWVSTGSRWYKELRPLQDFLFGEICDVARQLNIPVQIHTGMPEGNILPLDWGRPTRILELIQSFPGLEVHLLHLGHPYEPEAIAMAKMYRNVFLDCSWIHQLNANSMQFHINSMLDEVPVWKILGFGGDYAHMEGVFSHLVQARHNLTLAMSHRIESGGCNIGEAKSILTQMLQENPKRLLYNRGAVGEP